MSGTKTGNDPEALASCRLPTPWGDFQLHAFGDPATGREHAALTMGRVDDGRPVLTRLHSECLTGDGFYSLRCDCGEQLQAAMQKIAEEGRGAIVYLRQEGRGIGLVNKVIAYALQERGADTVEANRMLGFPDDLREYDEAKRLLAALGIASVRLMTNNPAKIDALTALGIPVVDRVPLHITPNPHNTRYLRTKVHRMGHFDDRAPAEVDDAGEAEVRLFRPLATAGF